MPPYKYRSIPLEPTHFSPCRNFLDRACYVVVFQNDLQISQFKSSINRSEPGNKYNSYIFSQIGHNRSDTAIEEYMYVCHIYM